MGPKKELLSLQRSNPKCWNRTSKGTTKNDFRIPRIFCDKFPKGPPLSREVTHSIEVSSGSEPTHQTPHWLCPAEQDELEEQARYLLTQAFIHPSHRLYGSAVLFVPKKDGRWRMCIDDHALKQQKIKDQYPLPRIYTLLNRFRQAKVFSKLHLASGYREISMSEDLMYIMDFKMYLGQW